MKRCSFEVAKAIKEAGYLQSATPYQYVTKNFSSFEEGEMIDSFFENWAGDNVVDAPYVMEVWLWLWQEKGICIEIKDNCYYILAKVKNQRFHGDTPEEAIISAIEYLVENDLIK